MLTTKEVDWMTYNTHDLPEHHDWLPPEPTRGGNYRMQHRCHETGAIAQFGNPNTEKFHVVLSGQSCAALPIPPEEYIEIELSRGSEFTRLDLAVTQYIDEDGLITVPQVLNWYRRGKVVSRWNDAGAQTVRRDWIGDEKPSVPELQTTYIGAWEKRAKKGIFRVYDKGREMDLSQFLITRFEVEDKRKHAQSSARAIAAGHTIGEVFTGRFNVLDEQWQAMVQAKPSDFMTGKSKGDTKGSGYAEKWAWLEKQVAPALGRLIAEDQILGDGDINYRNFMALVREHYDKHAKWLVGLDGSEE